MKRLFAVLLMISLLMCTSCSEPAATQVPTDAPTETPAAKNPAQEVIDRLMAAFGPELVAKAKSEGFSVTTDITCHTYTPQENLEGTEDYNTEDVMLISVCIRSAVGSTKYGENTVNVDTMKALQCAVINSGIFDLTEEVAEEYRNLYYTPERRYITESRPAANGIYVELHTNETPSGYEAICYVRHMDRHATFSRLLTYGHRITCDVTYKWDELFQ